MHKTLLTFFTFLITTSVLAVENQPAVIAVDVGHTIKDAGAISARGKNEFEFNRIFATVLANALREHELKVKEINFDGNIGGLTERPLEAAGSNFFISVHHDSIGKSHLLPWKWKGMQMTHTNVKRGYGIFVSANNPDLNTSLRCASAIGAMLRRSGFEPSTWHSRKHEAADSQNGVWYYNNLIVLYRTTLPAVLFEAGVIKHREEELELEDPIRQAKMADAIATGIAACMYVKEKEQKSPKNDVEAQQM